MKVKYIILLASFIAVSLGANAQQGRPLPILDQNPDARSAAMGGNIFGETSSSYIYINPTSLLYKDVTWNVTLGAKGFSKMVDSDRPILYNINGAYRWGDHAFFAGYRYLGGQKYTPINEMGVEKKEVKPYDWTIDLGYAYKFNDNISAYGSMSIVYSYIGKKAQTVAFNIGAFYRNTFTMSDMEFDYVVGIKGMNMGPKIDYGKKYSSANLPASFGGGGEIGMEFATVHRVSLAGGMQYFYLPKKAKAFSANIGGEYSFGKMIFARAGYNYQEHDMSHFAFGAGVAYKMLRLDGSYHTKANDNAPKAAIITLGVSF